MHKFSELKQIVETTLNGQLERLRVEYEDDTHMMMEFAYVGDDEYYMYYDVLIDTEQEKLSFKEHFCLYGRESIKVKRQPQFETAVNDYLFPNT